MSIERTLKNKLRVGAVSISSSLESDTDLSRHAGTAKRQSGRILNIETFRDEGGSGRKSFPPPRDSGQRERTVHDAPGGTGTKTLFWAMRIAVYVLPLFQPFLLLEPAEPTRHCTKMIMIIWDKIPTDHRWLVANGDYGVI